MNTICYVHLLNIGALIISLTLIFARKNASKKYIATILVLDTLIGLIIAYLGHCDADWWVFAANACITAEAAWGKKYFEREQDELN